LIAAHAELPQLMPYLHLPVQSGSDRILKAMNRGHTAESYLRLVEKIRAARPDIALSGDFIVGFPGESDAQFRRTVDLVEELGFDLVNTAAYSPRPNTPAADWPNQLSEEVKVERLREINALVERVAKARSARYAGRTEQVLVEGINPKDSEQVMGRTRTNRLTFFPATRAAGGQWQAGDLVDVRIDEVRAFSLSGTAQA
jgi:tRNA-2-methylthio-N6-dimethylallyladenosine synthase